MNFITSSKKSKCACCQSRKTNEYYDFDYCNIHIQIPLCEKCQKSATFNLWMQLKPLCTAISRAVTMSHFVGSDERRIRELQKEIRSLKGGAERCMDVNPIGE